MWQLLERYLDRLDDLRRFLAVADAIEKSTEIKWAHAKREARGSAIVCAMAELEALVVGVLCAVNEEINDSSTPIADLRSSLRPLVAHRELLSLAALADAEKVWRQRSVVTCLESSQDLATLPVNGPAGREPQPPLDGRTLKPNHLVRIGAVYGIDVASFIQTHETLSLKKLSDARNDIAHGNLPFHAVFSRVGFQADDIRSDLDAFDEIGYRFVGAFAGYIEREDYMAQPPVAGGLLA